MRAIDTNALANVIGTTLIALFGALGVYWGRNQTKKANEIQRQVTPSNGSKLATVVEDTRRVVTTPDDQPPIGQLLNDVKNAVEAPTPAPPGPQPLP